MLRIVFTIFLVFTISCACIEKPPAPIIPSVPDQVQIVGGQPLGWVFTEAATLVKISPSVIPAKAVAFKVTCSGVYYGLYTPEDLIYLPARKAGEQFRLELVYIDIEGVTIGEISYQVPLQ